MLDFVIEFINLWLSARQVCHVRPQAQNAGKIYPTCGFTCAAILTNSSISKKNIRIPDPLAKPFQSLSLSEHSPGTHHYPQQSSRADRHSNSHGQHSSHSHSQWPRGIMRRQTAPTDRRQVHQPLKCAVCFFVAKSKFIVTNTSFCNRFAGSPVAMTDMSHVGWTAQKRYV